jgi:hypothetical protein
MDSLSEIETWRATLTEAQRRRLNSPISTLANFRKATRIRSTPEHVIALQPAPAAIG